jgi:hypothetical protein
LSRKDDAEVIREVTASIEEAIAKNRRHELLVIAALLAMFLVGLGLLVYGAVAPAWQLLVPGGLVQLAIVFPVRKLIRLREENQTLRILPQLMRLATSQEAKRLAAELVRKLIEKV